MFADFLRSVRKRKSQTQVQAAAEVGVHVMTWSTWERGLIPSLQQMYKIADWSGESLDELRRHVEATEGAA